MISIAMTTYNGEKYLAEQLDSILAQTVKDFELVICDDCSTDGTRAVLECYAERDNRIKFFSNEENLGFVKNFEKAISLTKGEYIALCDQDDIWLTNHLEVLQSNIGDCDLCGADAVLVDENNKELGSSMFESIGADFLPQTQDEYLKRLSFENIFQGAACLFKRDVIQKALPVPQEVKFHDWWFAIVALSGNGVKYVKEPVLRYRQHGKNVTGTEPYNLLKKSMKILSSIKASKVRIKNYRISILVLLNEFSKIVNQNETLCSAKSFYENILFGKRLKACAWFIKNKKILCLTDSRKKQLAQLVKILLF